jgi:hypothetical protein
LKKLWTLADSVKEFSLHSQWYANLNEFLKVYVDIQEPNGINTDLSAFSFVHASGDSGNRITNMLFDVVGDEDIKLRFDTAEEVIEDFGEQGYDVVPPMWAYEYKRLNSLDAEKAEWLQTRVSDEQRVYGITQLPQTICCIRSMLKKGGIDDPIIKIMKSYVDYIYDKSDTDPDTPIVTMGKALSLNIDTSAPKRLLCLINVCIYYNSFLDLKELFVSLDLNYDLFFREIALFFLYDPYTNGGLLGELVNIISIIRFTLTRADQDAIHFADIDVSPFMDPIPHYISEYGDNDSVFYYAYESEIKSAINKSAIDVRDCTQLVKILKNIMYYDVSPETIRLAALLKSIPFYYGFARTNPFIAYDKQVHSQEFDAPSGPPNIETFETEASLYAHFYMNENIRGADAFNSWEQFSEISPTLATGKSAGGAQLFMWVYIPKQFRIEARFFKSSPGGDDYRHGDKDAWLKMNLNKKKALMALDYEFWLSDDGMWEMYTRDLPGRIGSRITPGVKRRRAIFMRKIGTYLAEYPIMRFLAQYQETRDRGVYRPMSSPDDFIVGKETGVVYSDHFVVCYSSTKSYLLELDLDYSKYDSRIKSDIYFEPFLEALKPLLDSYEFNNGTLYDHWKHLFSEGITKNAIYLAKDGKKEKEYELDMMLSGMFFTLHGNNVFNRIVYRYILSKLSQEGLGYGNLINVSIQGDDSRAVFDYRELKRLDMQAQITNIVNTTDRIAELVQLFNHTANSFKTGKWFRAGDFLRKQFIAGMYNANLVTQLCDQENKSDLLFFVEQMIGYFSTCKVLISRGLNWRMVSMIAVMTFNFRRGIRFYEDGVRKLVYLDTHSLSVPKSMKGIGELPNFLLAANIDGVIAHQCMLDSDFKSRIEKAAYILALNEELVKQSVADNLLMPGMHEVQVTDSTPSGLNLDPIKGVRKLEKILLKDIRVRDAIRAQNRNKERGIRHPYNLKYQNVPTSIVKDAIADDKSTVGLQLSIKNNHGFGYVKRTLSDDTISVVSSLWHAFLFQVVEIYEIPPESDMMHPFSGVSPLIDKLGRQLGMMTEAYRFRMRSVLDDLRRDPYFPKVFRTEHLVELLMKQNVIFNNDAMIDALIGAGALEVNAKKVVEKFMDQLSFSTMLGLNVDSYQDSLLPNFNMSQSNIEQFSVFMDNRPLLYNILIIHYMLLGLYDWFTTGVATGRRLRSYKQTYTYEASKLSSDSLELALTMTDRDDSPYLV